ncbi:MAG: sigma-70 family RNA polymerase sigma factor [Ruminococcaceae bacterium]|nr:sigma-70 family RNA polymerase sigma factor [Oscillospiraceae bacterium]
MLELMCQLLTIVLGVTNGGTFPRPLSPEEEKACLTLAAEGDLDARNKLIEHNLRLVAHIVKKYYAASPGDQEDLLSIGTIGLIKAINTYRPDRGTRLATYTARCIENEILMHFRAIKRTANEVSLSEPIETERDGGSLALMDVLSCEEDLAEELDARDDRIRMNRCLRTLLDDRERRIIAMRYGLLGVPKPLTQREIAEMCGISRSYVSRIEKKALGKLRAGWERTKAI